MQNNDNTLYTPYILARDIEVSGNYSFTSAEYMNLVDALLAVPKKKMVKTAELFKTLPKEEIIYRTSAICKLAKLLSTMQNNKYDIPSTSTEPERQ